MQIGNKINQEGSKDLRFGSVKDCLLIKPYVYQWLSQGVM